MRSFGSVCSLVACGLIAMGVAFAGPTVQQADAAPITILNSSFESPVTASYTSSPALGGWNYVNAGSFDYVQLFDSTLPAVSGVTTGTQYYGLYNSGSTTRVYQDTGVAWAPNTVYTLSLALGNRSGVIGATSHFGLSTDNTAANILGGAEIVNTSTIALQDWDTFTYSYTTGAVAPLGNIFVVVTKQGQGGDARVQLDNVQLDASGLPPAPEPASLVMLLGGALLTLRGRKKARTALKG